MAESDIVTLHCPLTDRTRGLIGADALARMRDGSCLINAARGALVDEAALIAELRSGRIQAGLDVFWHEPASARGAVGPAERRADAAHRDRDGPGPVCDDPGARLEHAHAPARAGRWSHL